MTVVLSQAPAQRVPWPRWLVREVWASVAIAVMWVAVVITALSGPDVVINNAGGFTQIPSAVIVAFFVCLATRWVAKYGLGQRSGDAG